MGGGGNNAYSIDGFLEESLMNSNTFVSALRMLALFFTLPLTKDEWPWVDPTEVKEKA